MCVCYVCVAAYVSVPAGAGLECVAACKVVEVMEMVVRVMVM